VNSVLAGTEARLQHAPRPWWSSAPAARTTALRRQAVDELAATGPRPCSFRRTEVLHRPLEPKPSATSFSPTRQSSVPGPAMRTEMSGMWLNVLEM
jgi:hypothetical protein